MKAFIIGTSRICPMAVILTALLAPQQSGSGMTGQTYDALFGTPIPGVKIKVLAEGQEKGVTMSDRTGHYDIPDLSPGQYVISAESVGFATTKHSVQVRTGQPVVLDIALKAGYLHDPLPIEIRGTVRHSDGTAARSSTITVVSPFNQQVLASVRSDEKGRFTLDVDYPGQYILFAFEPRYKVTARSIIVRRVVPRERITMDFVLSPFKLE